MRYIIGIDLGTTNCCVAYVDTETDRNAIQTFPVPQVTDKGVIEALPTLPSFCYINEGGESFVGAYARSVGSKTPTRLVQSAKSWLCQTATNRHDRVLPLEAADPSMRISPVEASSRYLIHIRDAWNKTLAANLPDSEFEEQEIILTVPASFDEVARKLTIEAAQNAGFKTLTLLEEPQAAFYSWISQHEKKWDKLMFPDAVILVCDVGGGTTDFSLIRAQSKGESLAFQRIAVGNHLLLGGDNMDATLAHLLENKLGVSQLPTFQWQQLCHEARGAKEALLSGAKTHKVVLQNPGSKIIQNSLTAEVGKEEIEQCLLNGFFGDYPFEEAIQLKKSAGLRAMGLPYEDEPSITKHLAHFLKQAFDPIQPPDFVLFNGGTMKPHLFQNSIIQSLKGWFPQKDPIVLSPYHLDLAVARGAAYYGKVRRGLGVKIGGGSARGYYLIVDFKTRDGKTTKKALTLLAKGFEEEDAYTPERQFRLKTNLPVAFQLCSSHVRLNDKPGDLVDILEEEMQFLPKIQTVLKWGKNEQTSLPATLRIAATPLGTLDLSMQSQTTPHSWSLEFQLRSVTGQENDLALLGKHRQDQTFTQSKLDLLEPFFRDYFISETIKSGKVIERLEEIAGMPRKDWPPSLLRTMTDCLLKYVVQRKRSVTHEERWWNLIGFTLRPGIGCPLDDFRMKEIWKVLLSELKVSKPIEIQIQKWICIRRLAAGLNKGQQRQLASELMTSILNKKSGKLEIKGKSDEYQFSEKVRALAAMEYMDLSMKKKLGDFLLKKVSEGEGSDADFWSLGRLGARQLFYGSVCDIMNREDCLQWIDVLLQIPKPSKALQFTFAQLARRTSHRELNLPIEYEKRILDHCQDPELADLIQQRAFTTHEKEKILGDSLPSGLLIEEN